MRDYRLLLGLTLRNRLATLRSGSWRKDNGKLDVNRIVISIVAVLSVAMVLGMIVFAEIKLFDVLKMFRQEALLPTLAIMLSMMSTLLLSFFAVLSGLYFSKDTAWMAYLPVRSSAVMAVKMTEIWLSEMLFVAAMLMPVSILYGIHLGAGALYYVRMALIMLLTPVIPLCIVAFLTSLLARCTSLVRHKEVITVMFSVVLLAAVLLAEGLLLPRIPDDADAMFFVRILMDNEGILNLLTDAIPPVRWAMHGLQGNWAEFGMFVVCCAAAIALMLLVLGPGYLNTCLKQGEQGTRRRKLKTSEKTYRQRTPLMAMFIKEWKAVIKSPTVAFNSLPSIFMFPLIVLVSGGALASTMDVNELLPELREMVGQISTLDIALIVGAVVSFSSFVNPAVASAVSREGSRLEISRMIPVSVHTQMTAKLLIGLLIDTLGVVIASAVLVALLPAEYPGILLGAVLALMLCYASSAMNLTLDAVRPNLSWTNEAQVVKQGANVAIGMLIGLAVFILPIIPPIFLLEASPVARFASAAGVLVLEVAAGAALMRFVAEKRFASLEPAA